ncbi:hypothetical protein HY638_02020 [Candidatus Woesearchaeota archaeon]|nr:hypothetical protein [Candidatus Woesearchaeota archaeon]
MRKAILLVLVLFLAASAYATITVPETSYKINATLVNQQPDPAQPGEIVEIRFKFENSGSERAESITVELLPKYPFSLLPGDSAQKSIGSLQGRQVGENGAIVKYRLKVDENAVEGENDLTVRYRIGTGGWITPKDFEISIRTFNAVLYVSDVDSQPGSIAPGGTGVVTITYRNLADSLLQNIVTRLDLKNVPIAPIHSSNAKTIEKIPALSTGKAEFTLMAEAGAKSKVYKIPFELSYNDELGTKYAINDTLGVVVGGVPDIAATIDTSSIVNSGSKGSVVIKFVNRGAVDTKFMTVKLEDTDKIKVIGNSEAYIGNIDSDDFETEEFTVYVEGTEDGYVSLPIVLSYKDANNNDYYEKKDLPIKVYTSSEASKYGLGNGNSNTGIIITLLIVAAGVAGYYYYRKRKK